MNSVFAGGNWPSTMALWLVDNVTWKQCNTTGDSCDTAQTQQVLVMCLRVLCVLCVSMETYGKHLYYIM